MAELLKNIYNDHFFNGFTSDLEKFLPSFNKKAFLKQIFDKEWEERAIKQRMRHISTTLKSFLPKDFEKAVEIILKFIAYQVENQNKQSLEYMFLPDYIEQYGMDDYETSMIAFEKITQFTSCEFAVRPFILKHPERLMKQMLNWSKHKNHNVRRFSSEGCRSRLPWSMALPFLKKDASPILPILENLKNDDSEYVRKSVANNLNDISKDHPKLVIKTAKKWIGKTKNTDWIVKHGCRTLLKQGNLEVMSIFGFGSIEDIEISHFEILTPKIQIGDYVEFSFQLHNKSDKKRKVRLEYGVYYQKANGSLNRKVFKISEKEYEAHSTTTIEKRQSFKVITTRKFHLGLHQISLIVNGNEVEVLDFELQQ